VTHSQRLGFSLSTIPPFLPLLFPSLVLRVCKKKYATIVQFALFLLPPTLTISTRQDISQHKESMIHILLHDWFPKSCTKACPPAFSLWRCEVGLFPHFHSAAKCFSFLSFYCYCSSESANASACRAASVDLAG